MIQTLFRFLSLVFDSSFNDLSSAWNACVPNSFAEKDRDAFHNEGGGGGVVESTPWIKK